LFIVISRPIKTTIPKFGPMNVAGGVSMAFFLATELDKRGDAFTVVGAGAELSAFSGFSLDLFWFVVRLFPFRSQPFPFFQTQL